jgi:hypothetical protein
MKAGSSFQKKRPSWPFFFWVISLPPSAAYYYLQPRCGFSRNYRLKNYQVREEITRVFFATWD